MDPAGSTQAGSRRLSPRFTIGQMMLVVLFSGLALAPISMYRQRAPVQWIVATVAFETIGLPAVVILLMLATMAPGPLRTRYIVILSATPTLLILGAFGIAEVAGVVVAFGVSIYRATQGNVAELVQHLVQAGIILCQVFLISRFCFPPRCPSCRRCKLQRTGSRAIGVGPYGTEMFECRQCGGHFSRNRRWGYPGALQSEPAPSAAAPDVPVTETHDS